MKVVTQVLLSACALMLCSTSNVIAASESIHHVDIPRQPVNTALNALAAQTGLQVIVNIEDALPTEVIAPSVAGELTVGEAMRQLLLDSGLRWSYVNERTVAVVRAGESGTAVQPRMMASAAADAPSPYKGQAEVRGMSAVSQETADRAPKSESRETDDARDEKAIDEVVVTGTQIHGATPSSRVAVFTRIEIEKEGFSTLRDFIEKLPSNFSGGASPNTIGIAAGGGANTANTVAGTGVNLRGLGNDATLVLLNGQRVAPASRKGNFVDVSMIPLAVIERIEVMADGASALYGSDAAGGVVNIILRKGFEGAETTLRYGSVMEGSREEWRASQLFGHSWRTGSGLFVYDFARNLPLYARDRDFTRDLVGHPFMLLPRTTTHTGLLSFNQGLTDHWELFGNGTFTARDLLVQQKYLTTRNGQATTDLKAYSANIGARGALNDQLALDVNSSYSQSHYTSASSDMLTGAGTGTTDVMTDVVSLDAKLSGEFGQLLAGALKFAVGGQFRHEKLDSLDRATAAFSGVGDRDVSGAFVEVHVPLLASRERGRPAVLELELADRQEHYSDFGDTNNPKVGLVWRAVPGLTVRTSYGTSFVAPLLYDLNPVPYQVFALPGTSIDLFGNTTGSPDTIFIFGGNPALTPQESKSWSLGFDFVAGVETPYKVYGNYFRTRYDNRIDSISNLLPNFYSIYAFEREVGSTVIQRDPTPGRVAELSQSVNWGNFGVSDLSTIGGVVDARQLNLSAVRTSGMDFGGSVTVRAGRFENEFGVDGTYLFEFDSQTTAQTPTVDMLNSAYNPIDLRFRARYVLRRGPLRASAFWNYTDSYYSNVRHDGDVASWSTIDLTFGYDVEAPSGWLQGVSTTLAVSNIADKDPPRLPIAIGTAILRYDGANANTLGRFIALQLRKSF